MTDKMPSKSAVVTRFAPSPTGALHLGGARTALFNWAWARHSGGRFVLRVEDTDRERSSDAALQSILEGLKWLGLDWDGEVVFQSARAARHREIAEQMLAAGCAYRCYASPAELDAMRAEAKRAGKPMRYNGMWRDRTDAPAGVLPVLRFRAPQEGSVVLDDAVQGRVEIAAGELDDLVLLRADGSPTYMLSVVVDDHDMGITHIVRGDDHLTNGARQMQIYDALGWRAPQLAHVPLLHDASGRKLSKRDGAAEVLAWRERGYLADAMVNYLARLGWSHGDDEIFSRKQLTEWFALDGIGRAPSSFDEKKLKFLNAHYLRALSAEDALAAIESRLPQVKKNPEPFLRASEALRKRATTLDELAEAAAPLYAKRPIEVAEAAAKHLGAKSRPHLKAFREAVAELPAWDEDSIHAALQSYLEAHNLAMKDLAPALRAAVAGQMGSLGLATLFYALGKKETLARLGDHI